MRISHLADHMEERFVRGKTVLLSYGIPVAFKDNTTHNCFQTEKYWSQTTLKHILLWLDGGYAITVPQAALDNLVGDSNGDV